MFCLEALSAGYGGHVVVKSISATINSGEITAIVGPNGHGKTTLMATLSGLLPVRSGTISFNGEDFTRLPPQERLRRGVVHVPQGDRLFPEMTVEENLLVGGTVLGDRILVQRQLDWTFGLLPAVAERKGRLASALSGGERRLVGLARGLMTSRRFMMLDEPSLGLSPVAVDTVYGIVRTLTEQGYSFLIIEENLDRVYEIAAHLMLIHDGRIAWSGSASDLREGGSVLKEFLGS